MNQQQDCDWEPKEFDDEVYEAEDENNTGPTLLETFQNLLEKNGDDPAAVSRSIAELNEQFLDTYGKIETEDLSDELKMQILYFGLYYDIYLNDNIMSRLLNMSWSAWENGPWIIQLYRKISDEKLEENVRKQLAEADPEIVEQAMDFFDFAWERPGDKYLMMAYDNDTPPMLTLLSDKSPETYDALSKQFAAVYAGYTEISDEMFICIMETQDYKYGTIYGWNAENGVFEPVSASELEEAHANLPIYDGTFLPEENVRCTEIPVPSFTKIQA